MLNNNFPYKPLFNQWITNLNHGCWHTELFRRIYLCSRKYFSSANIKQIYERFPVKWIAIPVSMNLAFTTRHAGFSTDLFLIASKYPEVGARLNIILGKIY